MAEGMLLAVAQKITEDLGSWAFQEIGSLWDVEAGLENIKNTVSTIQAVLQDAAEQQSRSHQVKDWLEKLKDAVYEVDDLLGEFYTEALRRGGITGNITKKVRDFFSTDSNPVVFRVQMSRKINAMKQKLNAIAEDRKMFHLKEYHVEPPVRMDREETHSFVANVKVIGREDDKEAIIRLLLERNNEENVSIVPIVGIGGLGKTTLAQFVYNDKNIKEHFELKMWICISDVFDVKMIIQKIISATGMEPVDHSMDKLQDQLRKIIDQKKYLLVLDDVWNEDPHKWDSLKDLLVGGAKGSKIVITARARLVAEITCPASIYTLKGLNEEQSWLLFKQIAFRKGQGQGTNNPRLEEIGREIVRKCQGIPLAIKSIGNVLRLEKTEHKWSYVKNNILEIATQQKNDIFPILKLSYDHLPSHLKSCFAFCSLFPKDYEIDKVTLIQLWIAQGFIRPSNKNQELEDVADEYFKDLLWRSFFEEVTNEKGELKYKMHDLIHDLAELVTGAECTIITLDRNNFDEKTRHVSLPFYIDSSFIETSGLLVRAEKLRTCLLTFTPSMAYRAGKIDESMLNKLIMSCRRLRALGLCGVHIERVPDSIEKFIHLTYLDFSENDGIETLPNTISRLWKLQTLKVNGCRKLKELPRDIRFLVGLRHLENSNCWLLSHMPNGLGQMTCLQTLSSFVVRDNQASTSGPISSGLDELNSLNSLRGELQISNLRCLEDVYSEPNAANLRAKLYLDRLTLLWHANNPLFCSNDDNDGDEKLLEGLQPHQNLRFLSVNGYGGVRFSSWLSLLTNLVNLSITGCKRCQQLPPLSQLHSLKRLSLINMEVLEYISDGGINEEVPTSSFFPSLKSIYISQCPNLKGWWRSTSTTDRQQHPHHQSLPSFHHLSALQIRVCPNLTSLPPFPYLEKSLYLERVSLKPLQRTIAINSSLPSSSSFLSSPLSKLKSMALVSIKDTEALPDEWMSNLSSLKELYIQGGPKLKSLSLAVPHLTSLEDLEICSCELFDSISDMGDDGTEWQHLKCLSSLSYRNVPNLKSIPSGLQHVTALRKLVISNFPNLTIFPKLTSVVYLQISWCPNLTSIPNNISNLMSLEVLHISYCLNLISLPDEMLSLKSLQKLIIQRCPDLAKRCEKGIGEDWFKIAHVPVIEIRDW
ncbi:putative disease resistance protein RGA3 [Quercus lobata]|uniref:putative disease resistance protein RGA3 n=1 Tax=Quercus lobata TaxID=97700 RepID=UPI0012478B31|nr:putative disease resistance protein RGA3 [Quercus lobata]XP_030965243.1 putative disease resistance protein RGA3 [Quercus lobata]XP_030965244.1 putative disease resistance protein RGA3 [Quercus lobata]XP_030965245.1 putative disease resistance protein RGA3 [Quercus lobata]XP_030965246.1 putative disease resistance protein RGA3 [Quercus lobata]XP_030965247.1 putative disease resistance protein RGA3 [Quercus lobata]XP_030965248.1 putative disease resistance protein RGA3 [Quercus lobata]XP_0